MIRCQNPADTLPDPLRCWMRRFPYGIQLFGHEVSMKEGSDHENQDCAQSRWTGPDGFQIYKTSGYRRSVGVPDVAEA